MVTLTLSGKLITLSKSLFTRCRNFTSVGVNENTVMVNLTTMVVNRILNRTVFHGRVGFVVEVLFMVINNVLCCVTVNVML